MNRVGVDANSKIHWLTPFLTPFFFFFYETIAVVAKFRYPWLPIERMLRHPFRAIDIAPQIKMPVLVLLAEFDEVIPIKTGRKLGAALGGPKEIITLPMGHMDINEHPGYFGAINAFVNR